MEPIIKPIKINNTDGGSETVYAEQVENDVFKLIENPVMHCRINYGTVVKALADANGDLVLSKIVRASNFKTRQFFLSASLTESELRTKIGQPVLDAGGMWEVVFGGICFVHIPKDSGFDIDALPTGLSVRISWRQSSCAARRLVSPTGLSVRISWLNFYLLKVLTGLSVCILAPPTFPGASLLAQQGDWCLLVLAVFNRSIRFNKPIPSVIKILFLEFKCISKDGADN